MKVCKKCGERYDDDKKFCKKCGGPLEEIQESPERGKKGKTGLILGLVGVLAAALLGGGVFAFYTFQERKMEEMRLEAQREEKRQEREEKREKEEEKKAEETKKKEKEKAEQEKKEQEKKQAELEKELKKKDEELKKAQEQQKQAEMEARAAEQEAVTAQQEAVRQAGSRTIVTAPPAYNPWDGVIDGAEAQTASIVAAGGDSMAVQQDVYSVWDGLLNDLWQELRATLPEGQMAALTDEQVAWIQNKEAMLNEYWGGDVSQAGGGAYKDGPAADITRERVYYLRGLLPY